MNELNLVLTKVPLPSFLPIWRRIVASQHGHSIREKGAIPLRWHKGTEFRLSILLSITVSEYNASVLHE